MRASIHDAGDTDAIIISRAKARASILMNGEDGEVSSITYTYSLCLKFVYLWFSVSVKIQLFVSNLIISFLYDKFNSLPGGVALHRLVKICHQVD